MPYLYGTIKVKCYGSPLYTKFKIQNSKKSRKKLEDKDKDLVFSQHSFLLFYADVSSY
jgi:hypothetical protein